MPPGVLENQVNLPGNSAILVVQGGIEMLPDTCSRWLCRAVHISCLLLVWISSWQQEGVRAQEYARPVRVGTISDSRVDEVSGMVPITGLPDYFWIHNDSKDTARLFAVRKNGVIVAEVQLPGASNIDFEDIATGPGPDPERNYLFIADTGNNALNRTQLVIWRLPEPNLPSTNLGQRLVAERSEPIRFRYPAGTFNNEALIVHPLTGRIYIITKVSGPAVVYRFPSSVPGGAVQTLVRVASMNIGGLVTAADLTEDGRRMLVRTFPSVQEYRLPQGAPFESIFTQPRIILPNAGVAEPKSESICFDLEDRDFFTSNEGNPAPIHQTSLLEQQPFCSAEEEAFARRLFTRGDLVEASSGSDVLVDLNDVLVLLSGLRDELVFSCPDAADFDDNGILDSWDFNAMGEALVEGSVPPAPYLRPGWDPTFDELDCELQGASPLVPAASTWNYWYSESAPGENWRLPSFDAGSWDEGTSGIGFGSITLVTQLNRLAVNRRIFFARHSFDISDPAAARSLWLRIDYNDGFIAYINGMEVARRGLGDPGYVVPSSSYARYHRGGLAEDVLLCRESLLEGENILAIEVYNRSRLDGTLFFHAELLEVDAGKVPPPAVEGIDAQSAAWVDLQPSPILDGEGVLGIYCRSDAPVVAGSIALSYEAGHLDFSDPVSPAGVEVDWLRVSIDEAAGTVSCVFICDIDGGDGQVLPPFQDIEFARLRYRVRTGRPVKTQIRFADREGAMPLENRFLGAGGGEIRLETMDLEIEITDNQDPMITAYVNERGPPGGFFYVVGRHFSNGINSVRVCGRDAEFDLLDDGQTIQVIAPACETEGPASVEICTEAGCVLDEGGFFYTRASNRWIRGDTNGDGVLDISDPILLLGRLFLGGATTETCPLALDVNADEVLDISDPIVLLGFLFLGNMVIPPPNPGSEQLCP